MKHFSVPYECIFHLGCIGFSANAQFSHGKTSLLKSGYACVLDKNFDFQNSKSLYPACALFLLSCSKMKTKQSMQCNACFQGPRNCGCHACPVTHWASKIVNKNAMKGKCMDFRDN